MSILNWFKKFIKKTDKSKIRGELTFILKDKYGNVKRLWNENFVGKFIRMNLGLDLKGVFFLGHWDTKLQFHNLIPTAGKAGMASRCNGAGAEAAFTYLAVGIGTTAANAADTTLGTEITDSGLARAAATCTRITTSVTNDTAQLDKTWSVTGTKAVTEAGGLNAASTGTLLGRQVFSAVNVASGDSLQVTYKFQFS
jgi:hypothetical protein